MDGWEARWDMEGVCRMGRGEQAQGGLWSSLWPIGKQGLTRAVPAPSTGAYGGAGAERALWVRGDAGVRRPQVLEGDHQWWKLRNRSGQAGYVPGNILAETRPEDALLEQVRRRSAPSCCGVRPGGGGLAGGGQRKTGPEPGPRGYRGWCGGSPAQG